MRSLKSRFQAKFQVAESGCWEWTAAVDGHGYGQFFISPEVGKKAAHRVSYEMSRGPIPDGLVIDHLCRNPRCVNPDHLEPVTFAENVRRGNAGAALAEWVKEQADAKTHCANGHPWTSDTVRLKKRKNGTVKRECKQCHSDRESARGRAQRAQSKKPAA